MKTCVYRRGVAISQKKNNVLIGFISLVSCREYLATFKKTVAMHENFLKRLAAHPTLRNDHNYQVFLEFSGDVSQLVTLLQRFMC